jgi:DNA-binding NarL/FixJ family response regulator
LAAFEALGAASEVQRVTTWLSDLPVPGATRSDCRPEGLSRRELEVLCLVAEGLSNRRIAARLHVSEFTVKRHVQNILAKLDLPTRAAASAYAARQGLL